MSRRTAAHLIGLLIAVVMFVPSMSHIQADAPMTPFPATPVSPVPPAGSISASTVLTLTSGDNGSSFTVPLNTLIVVQIPVYGRMALNFDPTILQLVTPPLPIPDTGFIDPAETPIPVGMPFPIFDGWQLRAIGPGTTSLSVVNQPCPPGVICPLMPIINFNVTITVEYPRYPPVTPYPPYPPIPPSVGDDVYISTAYLNQTVSVQPGQTITLDLPFLAVGKIVTMQFDPTILQPLYAQYAQSGQGTAGGASVVQPGGWRFRVVQVGTTTLTVWNNACPDGGSDCASPLIYKVTIQAGFDDR